MPLLRRAVDEESHVREACIKSETKATFFTDERDVTKDNKFDLSTKCLESPSEVVKTEPYVKHYSRGKKICGGQGLLFCAHSSRVSVSYRTEPVKEDKTSFKAVSQKLSPSTSDDISDPCSRRVADPDGVDGTDHASSPATATAKVSDVRPSFKRRREELLQSMALLERSPRKVLQRDSPEVPPAKRNDFLTTQAEGAPSTASRLVSRDYPPSAECNAALYEDRKGRCENTHSGGNRLPTSRLQPLMGSGRAAQRNTARNTWIGESSNVSLPSQGSMQGLPQDKEPGGETDGATHFIDLSTRNTCRPVVPTSLGGNVKSPSTPDPHLSSSKEPPSRMSRKTESEGNRPISLGHSTVWRPSKELRMSSNSSGVTGYPSHPRCRPRPDGPPLLAIAVKGGEASGWHCTGAVQTSAGPSVGGSGGKGSVAIATGKRCGQAAAAKMEERDRVHPRVATGGIGLTPQFSPQEDTSPVALAEHMEEQARRPLGALAVGERRPSAAKGREECTMQPMRPSVTRRSESVARTLHLTRLLATSCFPDEVKENAVAGMNRRGLEDRTGQQKLAGEGREDEKAGGGNGAAGKEASFESKERLENDRTTGNSASFSNPSEALETEFGESDERNDSGELLRSSGSSNSLGRSTSCGQDRDVAGADSHAVPSGRVGSSRAATWGETHHYYQREPQAPAPLWNASSASRRLQVDCPSWDVCLESRRVLGRHCEGGREKKRWEGGDVEPREEEDGRGYHGKEEKERKDNETEKKGVPLSASRASDSEGCRKVLVIEETGLANVSCFKRNSNELQNAGDRRIRGSSGGSSSSPPRGGGGPSGPVQVVDAGALSEGRRSWNGGCTKEKDFRGTEGTVSSSQNREHQAMSSTTPSESAFTSSSAGIAYQDRKNVKTGETEPHDRTFRYVAVVRKKAERDALAAIDCPACRAFYGALSSWNAGKNAPSIVVPKCMHAIAYEGANSEQGMSRCGTPSASESRAKSLSPSGCDVNPIIRPLSLTAGAQPLCVATRDKLPVSDGAHVGASDSKDVEHWRGSLSRHRVKFLPPETPKGFWDVGFADEFEA